MSMVSLLQHLQRGGPPTFQDLKHMEPEDKQM